MKDEDMWYDPGKGDEVTRTHRLVVELAGEAFSDIIDARARDGLDDFIEKIKQLDLEPEVMVQIYLAACDYRGAMHGAAARIRTKIEDVIDAALPVDCARDIHSPCCRRP